MARAFFRKGFSILMIGLMLIISSAFMVRAQNPDSLKLAEAKIAIDNHYYLPAEILFYQQQLGLTPVQVSQLKAIEATLTLKEKETGGSNMRNEKLLDSLFRTGRLNEGNIIFFTNRYGLYRGEYRGEVLLACYHSRKVLNPQQLKKLVALKNHN